MIGIIGALEEEIEILKKDMQIEATETVAKCEYIKGKLFGRDAVVTRCGMGKVNAACCASVMIERYSPDIIINTGVGGSLDPNLKVLDIAIANDIVQHDYDIVSLGYSKAQVDKFDSPFFVCDKALNDAVKQYTQSLGLTSYFTRFATGDRFIDNPEEKQSLATVFNAQVCDMESGAIAQVCALCGVRFASIRAISDSGSDTDGAMQFFEFLKAASSNSVKVVEEVLKGLD